MENPMIGKPLADISLAMSNYLEIFTTYFGWFMNNRILAILMAIGVYMLPFIFMLIREMAKAWWKFGFVEGGRLSSMPVGYYTLTMALVYLVAFEPSYQIKTNAMHFTPMCSDKTVTGDNTGTTYDVVFGENMTASVYVPIWWGVVAKLADGINAATIASIPCEAPDMRFIQYKLSNTTITDPDLRREVQQFKQDCHDEALYLRRRYGISAGDLTASDLQWLANDLFMTHPKLYPAILAEHPVRGFPIVPSRDAQFDSARTGLEPHPSCRDWWLGPPGQPKLGLRKRLIDNIQGDSLFASVNAKLGKLAGTIGADSFKDFALKQVIMNEKSTLEGFRYTGDLADQSQSMVSQAVAEIMSIFGLGLENFKKLPVIYLIKQMAPMAQAFLLGFFYTLLPFILIIGMYDIATLLTLTAVFFGIKFFTSIWAILVYFDNNLTLSVSEALLGTGSMVGDGPAYTTGMLLNLMIGTMYLLVPMMWLTLLGYAGVSIHGSLSSFMKGFESDAIASGQSAMMVGRKIATRGK